MGAFDGFGTREVRPVDRKDFEKLSERVSALEALGRPSGCICPPTAEQTCKGTFCPRKPFRIGV
jgi:hypothetical protein